MSFYYALGGSNWLKHTNKEVLKGHITYLEERKEAYPCDIRGAYTLEDQKIAHKLNKDGCVIFKHTLDMDLLDDVCRRFDIMCKETPKPKNLKINEYQKSLNQHGTLLEFPELLEVATNQKIIKVLENFFQCSPALVHAKIIKTYPKKTKRKEGTQLFHFDKESLRLVKVFIYLNDVKDSSYGPLTYVKGSHMSRITPSIMGVRYHDRLIGTSYGNSITPMLGSRDDIIFCNTTGIHKAGIVENESKVRTAISFTYMVHPSNYICDDNTFLKIPKGMRKKHYPYLQYCKEI